MKYLAACFVIIALGVALVPFGVHAQTNTAGTSAQCSACDKKCSSYTAYSTDHNEVSPKIEVSIPIPGVTESVCCYDNDQTKACREMNLATDLGDYLAKFYTFFVGIVGILATVMVLYGAIRWILAAGNQSRISGAKTVITSAIIGVVIAFTSYLLLFLLNPRLINFSYLSKTISTVQVTNVASPTSIQCDSLPAGTSVELENRGRESSYSQYKTQDGIITPYSVLCDDLAQTVDPTTKELGTERCVGTYCLPQNSFSGLCYLDIGRCLYGTLSGRINWEGNGYVNEMYLEAVCKNYTRVSESALQATIAADRHTYFFSYGVGQSLLSLDNKCGGESQVLGYYLNIEINDDQGGLFGVIAATNVNDNYAVGKDGKPLFMESPENIKNWQSVSSPNLLKSSSVHDASNPTRLDLSIDRTNFPAR